MDECLISIQNISVSFNTDFEKKTVISGFSLDVKKGQFIALVGSNGSGKSTLIKALLKIIPHSGTICINTQSIGFLPQSYLIDRSFPIHVFEYIKSGLIKEAGNKSQKETQIREIMSLVKIDNLKETFISELSQGQFQKVLFARSLVSHPRLLILDEPFSNIDEMTATHLKEILVDINKKGVTIIVSLHDSEFVSSHCSQIIQLGDKNINIVDPCAHPHHVHQGLQS